MDTFFTQKHCDRCYGSLAGGRIMSMYNDDCICLKCKEEERQRADYKAAVQADHEAIRRGNHNFPGIGYEAPKVAKSSEHHRCKYCGVLTAGADEDVLCGECREIFGHYRYSEL